MQIIVTYKDGNIIKGFIDTSDVTGYLSDRIKIYKEIRAYADKYCNNWTYVDFTINTTYHVMANDDYNTLVTTTRHATALLINEFQQDGMVLVKNILV